MERQIEQFWTNSLSQWEFNLEAGTAFSLDKLLGGKFFHVVSFLLCACIN